MVHVHDRRLAGRCTPRRRRQFFQRLKVRPCRMIKVMRMRTYVYTADSAMILGEATILVILFLQGAESYEGNEMYNAIQLARVLAVAI